MYAKRPKGTNELLLFLAKHMLIGMVFGWFILGVFIFTDVGGLRTLISANHVEYIVYPLLLIFFAITFGSVGMGIGVMGIDKNDDDDDNDKGLKISLFPEINFSKPIRQSIPLKK